MSRPLATLAALLSICLSTGCSSPGERIVREIDTKVLEIPEPFRRLPPPPVISARPRTEGDQGADIQELNRYALSCAATVGALDLWYLDALMRALDQPRPAGSPAIK